MNSCFPFIEDLKVLILVLRLNTLRSQLSAIKLTFIDEISMVGSGMFNV